MRSAGSRFPQVALLSAAALLTSGLARGAPAGAEVFAARCAVCHGAKAEGLPGSFPPLAGQIQALAALPAGRDYLVMAVSAGLIGTLTVADSTYHGAMPAQSMLSEAEVAAVLNYLSSALGKKKSDAMAFDAAEVSAVRARHASVSGPAALALRPSLPDR
jgi:mono/diheme cytochrome c family protein